MHRPEVARVAGIIGEALGVVRFAVKDEAALDHLQSILGEAMDILYRPADEAPGDMREYWREQKAKQRSAKKEEAEMSKDVQDKSGTVREMSEIAVVVEAEEEAEEDRTRVSIEDVDLVLDRWNEITGSAMRSGPTRSKKAAGQIKALLDRVAAEEGDVEAGRLRIEEVVKWLWKDRAGTELARYVVPTTVCRKWDSYIEQMSVPTNGGATGSDDWTVYDART